MSSRNTTPFIPPLHVDPSPRPPGAPPLPPQEPPEWSTPPLVPGNFSHYPSPYTGPTFLPPPSGPPPNFMPGSYIPAPSQLPPADWPGQPQAGPQGSTPWANTWAAAPPTVYNNFTQSLSPPPPGFMPITPAQQWGGLPPGAYNTQGPPPQFGMMPMQGPWPAQAGGPAIGKSLGGPGLGAAAIGKSLGGPGLGPPGFGPQMGPGPPGPGYGPPPGMGGPGLGPVMGVGLGGPGLPPAVGARHGGPGLGPHGGIEGPSTRRPHGEDFALRHFAVGRHYGPVLNPMTLHIVKAKPTVNPLLCPPSDSGSQHFLEWNMLFPSRACRRSNDPPNRSWMDGRDEPATFPRVSELRLFTRALPWEVKIIATNMDFGVTCADVIEGLDNYLHRPTGGNEFYSQSMSRQREISQSYHTNRSTEEGVPGGALGRSTLRLDWLCDRPMFGGIVKNEVYCKEMYGKDVPNLFEWKCEPRYMHREDEGLTDRLRALEVGDSPDISTSAHRHSDGSPQTFTSSTPPESDRSGGESHRQSRPRGADEARMAENERRGRWVREESRARRKEDEEAYAKREEDQTRQRLDKTRRMEAAARAVVEEEEGRRAEVLKARAAEERAQLEAKFLAQNVKPNGRHRPKSVLLTGAGAYRPEGLSPEVIATTAYGQRGRTRSTSNAPTYRQSLSEHLTRVREDEGRTGPVQVSFRGSAAETPHAADMRHAIPV